MSDVAMAGPVKYERIEGDAYFTREEWVTEALLDARPFPNQVWECAAGGGHMVNVLRGRGHTVRATDITDHGFPLDAQQDFLTAMTYDWPGAVITNPPYDHAEAFIRKALLVTQIERGCVAMLLRNEYDCAKSRSYLFAEHPAFFMKIVLRRRPRWVEGPGASPRHNFAWYVWDWANTHQVPAIRWAA